VIKMGRLYSSSEIGAVLLVALAMKSTKTNLTTPLRPILEEKVWANPKCEFLCNCSAQNSIPKRVLPSNK